MIQRVMPMPTARQISATHHLPGRIGSRAELETARPVIIGMRQLPPAQAVIEDRQQVQCDQTRGSR